MRVITRTEATNAVSTYYVSALAGPRINRFRVVVGQKLSMREYEARALLASGALVTDEARVNDPFDTEKAAADAKAAEAKALADKAAADAKAKASQGNGDQGAASDGAGGTKPVKAG